jgi:hydroxypyruvate reductase
MKGRGGRCSEFLLSLFSATEDLSSFAALAADTDGIDGSEDNAGAWFDASTRSLALDNKMSAKKYLSAHDAFGFFEETKTLLFTGPTLTNVNDFRILLIDSE